MHDLTAFQRDLLIVIAGLNEPHGLAVKEEIEDYYEKKVQHGHLYPNLDTLVEMGFIEKGSKDQRTNEYILLDRGRRELDERQEWEEAHIRSLDIKPTTSD